MIMYVIAAVFTLFMVLVFGLVFNPPTKWAHKMTGDDEAKELEADDPEKGDTKK